MPTYLADLSGTDPQDVEAVSQGASRIRTLTNAAKATMDVEHTQTGEHQFPVAQPGTPVNGQIWFDLVNKVIRRYDGSDHTQVNAIALSSGTGSASTALTSSYASMATANATTFAGSRVLLIAQFVASTTTAVTCKFIRGVTDVSATVGVYEHDTMGAVIPFIFVDVDSPTAGTYTYALQAKGSGLVVTPLVIALVL